MIILIHGDDIAKSRKYYTDLKEQHPEARILEGAEINLTELAQVLEGGSLFSDENIVFIENFSSKKKSANEYKELTKYLVNQPPAVKIIIWEGKELEKSSLIPFKQAAIKLFKLPQSLFTFLDSLKPGNYSALLKLFHQALQTTDEESVFYLLVRHIRILLALHPDSNVIPPRFDSSKRAKAKPDLAKAGIQEYDRSPAPTSPSSAERVMPGMTSENISELVRLQPWQKDKLVKQSRLFNIFDLIRMHDRLFQIESELKTGSLPNSVISKIDIFLLDI